MYFKYVKILFKAFLQYRASMWIIILSQFAFSFVPFAAMYLLFEQFGTVEGWTFGEAAMCFAVIYASFSITEFYARGFDRFAKQIVAGDFDRILLRPRGTMLQVFGSEIEFSRVGRLAQSIVALGVAILLLDITWDFFKITTLIFMIASGVVIFTGIFILGATVCFFTIQGLEVLNVLTYGSREMAQYPLSIYNKWIIRFFTFVIPFGCVNYLPLMYLTGRVEGDDILHMLTPLAGMLFIMPCMIVWNYGVKRYVSTGN